MKHNYNIAPSPDALRQLFLKRSVLTMLDLKAALATQVPMTVFRNLRRLSYLSSYSHRGAYYTLAEIPRFNQLGLWSFRDVRFSQHGTLLNTCAVLVAASEAGYTSDELEHLLQVQVKDPLRKRVRRRGGGRPPMEKNARSDRCHRTGDATRRRRRSDHRHPLDAPYH